MSCFITDETVESGFGLPVAAGVAVTRISLFPESALLTFMSHSIASWSGLTFHGVFL